MRVLLIGVGAFTHGLAVTLQRAGAECVTWLNRDYAHYGPSQASMAFTAQHYPDPLALLEDYPCDIMIPMSIDWATQPWATTLQERIAIFCPSGEALQIERDRAFAQQIGSAVGIRFPHSFVANNRLDAQAFLDTHDQAYVIKNTLCSPTSPIHTIVCETTADTRSWLDRIDYAEGVFFQEYMGHKEAGHIVFVNRGKVTSLITNQEYKRAFAGNMGKIAGAPLGGIVEQDPYDKYGLCAALIGPLQDWLTRTQYTGPLQVTAMMKDEQWSVIEYNARLGVMCGPIIMHMLHNPLDMLQAVIDPSFEFTPKFKSDIPFGCSITLAGYGYPFLEVTGPACPVHLPTDRDHIWLNEVTETQHEVLADGHRLLDVNGYGTDLNRALVDAYQRLAQIQCSNSYYRPDIGLSLWPPGAD